MFRFGDPGGRMYGAVGTSNVNLLALYTTVDAAAGVLSVNAGTGRGTGSSLRMLRNAEFGNLGVVRSLDNQPTWGAAFACRFTAWPSAYWTLLRLLDATSVQVDLRVNSTGTVEVTRNGTSLGLTPSLVALNTWAHYELKVKVDPTGGTVYLGVNGAQQLSLAAQNTRATGNSYANGFAVGQYNNNSNPGATFDFDDLIVYDGQTTDANGNADITGPVGDCGLAWLLPTGAGATTQFTPDSGTNYARVNEATPDGDTSYVESATVGNIDTYAMADLPAGATAVKSVASIHYARKTDVGGRGMKAELRSGGGNAAHVTEIALGNSYQYYFSNWGRDPNNGTPADWTVAAVNALEAGQTVSS